MGITAEQALAAAKKYTDEHGGSGSSDFKVLKLNTALSELELLEYISKNYASKECSGFFYNTDIDKYCEFEFLYVPFNMAGEVVHFGYCHIKGLHTSVYNVDYYIDDEDGSTWYKVNANDYIKISTLPNNALQEKSDGLYVSAAGGGSTSEYQFNVDLLVTEMDEQGETINTYTFTKVEDDPDATYDQIGFSNEKNFTNLINYFSNPFSVLSLAYAPMLFDVSEKHLDHYTPDWEYTIQVSNPIFLKYLEKLLKIVFGDNTTDNIRTGIYTQESTEGFSDNCHFDIVLGTSNKLIDEVTEYFSPPAIYRVLEQILDYNEEYAVYIYEGETSGCYKDDKHIKGIVYKEFSFNTTTNVKELGLLVNIPEAVADDEGKDSYNAMLCRFISENGFITNPNHTYGVEFSFYLN